MFVVFYLFNFRRHNDNSISHDWFYRAHCLPFPRWNCLSFCKISQHIKGLKVQIKTIPSTSFPSSTDSLFLFRQTPTSSSYKNNSGFGTFRETGKSGKTLKNNKKKKKKTNFAKISRLPFAAETTKLPSGAIIWWSLKFYGFSISRNKSFMAKYLAPEWPGITKLRLPHLTFVRGWTSMYSIGLYLNGTAFYTFIHMKHF